MFLTRLLAGMPTSIAGQLLQAHERELPGIPVEGVGRDPINLKASVPQVTARQTFMRTTIWMYEQLEPPARSVQWSPTNRTQAPSAGRSPPTRQATHYGTAAACGSGPTMAAEPSSSRMDVSSRSIGTRDQQRQIRMRRGRSPQRVRHRPAARSDAAGRRAGAGRPGRRPDPEVRRPVPHAIWAIGTEGPAVARRRRLGGRRAGPSGAGGSAAHGRFTRHLGNGVVVLGVAGPSRPRGQADGGAVARDAPSTAEADGLGVIGGLAQAAAGLARLATAGHCRPCCSGVPGSAVAVQLAHLVEADHRQQSQRGDLGAAAQQFADEVLGGAVAGVPCGGRA